MNNRTRVILFLALAVIVAAGTALSFTFKQGQARAEIAAYLEQFKPTNPEGVAYIESHNLLPERPITANFELFADLIVRGGVVNVGDAYRDEHGLTYHTVSVEVSTIYKGGELAKTGDVVEVDVLGGTVDGQMYFFVESPHFVKGEDVIVFLTEGEDGYFTAFQAYGKVLITDGKAIGIDDDQGVFEKPIAEYEHELRGYIAT